MSIGCTVFVDGARMADGSTGDDPQDPTILSALSISWGRDTTVDQPAASTCSFTVRDDPGGSTFLEVMAVGSRIDISATGGISFDHTKSIIVDSTFDNDPVGFGPPVVLRNVAGVAVTAEHTARATPPLAGRWSGPLRVTFPPAPFNPSDVAAWDNIPPTIVGTGPWHGALDVMALGAPPKITVDIPTFAGPTSTAYTVTAPQTVPPAAPGVWTHYEGQWSMPLGGRWPGMTIELTPAAWQDIDPALTWETFGPGSWADQATFEVDNLDVLVPGDYPQQRTAAVWSGRITELSAGYDEIAGAPSIDVIAADYLAELGNRDVGDEPWPAETMAKRFDRVIAAAKLAVTRKIDANPGARTVSWQDVDRRATLDVLDELATSTDAILWSADHSTTGPYLWMQDTNRGVPLGVLVLGDDGIVRIDDSTALGAIHVDACDVLRDPVTWRQSVADVTTRAAIRWLEQTVDDDGLPSPTERTIEVIDTALETKLGTRRISVGTILSDGATAQTIADGLIARLSVLEWRIGGLDWDTALSEPLTSTQTNTALDLLDGVRRLGASLFLDDLPEWTPEGASAGLFLEGGDYSYRDGAWELSMVVSSATARGATAAWNQLDPAWQWQQFDTAISWDTMRGVGPAPAQQEVT